MKIDKEDYVKHIVDIEKKQLAKKLLDKIEKVLLNHTVESTDFLDPYEREIFKSILNRFSDINYLEYGGLESSERKIISIYQDYYNFEEEDYEIKALELYDYHSSFNHRDFLGSVLALGIVRQKIGDILVHNDRTQLILKREVADYVYYNLHRIGNERIKVRNINLEEIEEIDIQFIEKQDTISSPRLDNLVSSAFNLPRKDSQILIIGDKVKVNWKEINKTSYEIEEGDLISVRGYGRFTLHSTGGLTRKNRINVTVRLLK